MQDLENQIKDGNLKLIDALNILMGATTMQAKKKTQPTKMMTFGGKSEKKERTDSLVVQDSSSPSPLTLNVSHMPFRKFSLSTTIVKRSYGMIPKYKPKINDAADELFDVKKEESNFTIDFMDEKEES